MPPKAVAGWFVAGTDGQLWGVITIAYFRPGEAVRERRLYIATASMTTINGTFASEPAKQALFQNRSTPIVAIHDEGDCPAPRFAISG